MVDTVADSDLTCNAKIRYSRTNDAVEDNAPTMKTRIRDLRLERGWTVGQLAERVGMSRSYVSEIETGKKTVNNVRLAMFAKAFGVSVLDLISEDDLPSEILEHVRRLQDLPPDMRESVIQHALALSRARDD